MYNSVALRTFSPDFIIRVIPVNNEKDYMPGPGLLLHVR